ncbi:peptide deformylase [Filifactor alocis ATCC 35896]|uniref:Peptide deformylase n=1 Tax=Filifactor alocis (strain ATCC 35896 / CCUG 47790 / D40 B5) TaxID=546269 RepID=D6GQM8_FILAD|nr:peptide deformylase [Filifactor alocis]EFE29081.1 peptide deformylase [Filifactor alocis ATCC 35896]
MAIREVRIDGDEVLRKVSRPVTEMTPRIEQLIGDMIDTMYQYDGVGLAAPQVGVLRRVIVIDIGEGPMVFINPEIVEQEGEQCGQEGCLSIPGVYMDVKRPNHVVVTAKNEKMEDIRVEGDELLARALCHEIDHLNGILFKDIAERE